METTRYVVAATLMATILTLFWRAGLARRKLLFDDSGLPAVLHEWGEHCTG